MEEGVEETAETHSLVEVLFFEIWRRVETKLLLLINEGRFGRWSRIGFEASFEMMEEFNKVVRSDESTHSVRLKLNSWHNERLSVNTLLYYGQLCQCAFSPRPPIR
jgi:hypothetical protein